MEDAMSSVNALQAGVAAEVRCRFSSLFAQIFSFRTAASAPKRNAPRENKFRCERKMHGTKENAPRRRGADVARAKETTA
jgi:hypothetical protein